MAVLATKQDITANLESAVCNRKKVLIIILIIAIIAQNPIKVDQSFTVEDKRKKE